MAVYKEDCWILNQDGPLDTSAPAIQAHLAKCADCRAFVAALSHMDALSDGGNIGPVAALDDIARRRLLNAIVDQSEVPVKKQSGRPAMAKWVALAAAVVIGGFAALYLSRVDTGTEAGETGGSRLSEGALVLVAGQSGELQIGAPVREKEVLSTGANRAVVALPTGVKVALGENTRLRFTHLNSDAMRIDLDTGSVLIVATPGRKGPKFVIGTADGDVTITGTALTVTKVNDDFEVRVLRGRVEVKSPKVAELRVLKMNQTTLVGRPGVGEASAGPSSVEAMMSSMELISVDAPSSLSIDSTPAGATVSVDGVVLGHTPIEASLRPGHRRLDIALEGFSPVSEIGSFAEAGTFSRTYILQKEIDTDGASSLPKPVTRSKQAVEKTKDLRDAGAMLKDAQQLRAARNWTGAAAAYRALISSWPGSGEARNAHISLGQIELRQLGRPAAALEQFDSYLRAGRGPLHQEALLGKADALGALGRKAEEKAVLRDFLNLYPNALSARKAEDRLNRP